VQFGSVDDPFLDIDEQDLVAKELNATYHRFEDRGHFMVRHLPEVIEAAILLVQEEIPALVDAESTPPAPPVTSPTSEEQ
jgi:hypothetical protein